MKLEHVAVAVAFALLLGAGNVAAAPGSASDGGGHATDAGPPGDLPEPVPEFVTELLGGIEDALAGGVDHLGEVVRDLTPGGPGDAPARG